MLTRLSAPLAKLPLSDAQLQRVLGPQEHVDQAIAQGRLYIADDAVLDGCTGGTVDQYRKYLWAPIVVYAWRPEAPGQPGARVVVGIQCGQDPASWPLWQPGDGDSWRMAKVTVASADSQVQGLVVHFGLCHVVMESVALATRRTLARRHPLRALLAAHTEDTLEANDITRSALTPVGGTIDRLQAQSRDDSLALVVQAVRDFRRMQSSPPEDFARRGVDDTTALPAYPFRDDQLLLWEAVSQWVEDYVRAYYGDDAAVQRGGELQDFVAEMQGLEQGRLAGIGAIQTVQRLVHLMSRIVFGCGSPGATAGTAGHAAALRAGNSVSA